jgi:hypothetical protein
MADEVEMSQLLKDMLAHEEGTAAEELRMALNDIIAKHQLHASVVISLLARLSAGCIHITQKYYNSLNADVVVEEDFQNMLTAHLTDLDMSDVKEEIEKIKREELN